MNFPGRRPFPGGLVFLIRFAALAVGGLVLLLLEPIDEHLTGPFTEGLTALSAVAIQLCGGSASANGTLLTLASGSGGIRVAGGCNAVEVSIVFAAAVLAFPAPVRLRLVGAVAGIGLLQSINFLRIISLLYLSDWSHWWFDFLHLYLWDAVITLDAVVIFLGWCRWQAGRSRSAAA